jgi:hypothetical protein
MSLTSYRAAPPRVTIIANVLQSAPVEPVPRRYALQGMRLRPLRLGRRLGPAARPGELPVAQRRPYNSFLALVNTYVGTVRPLLRPARAGIKTSAYMAWNL